MKSKQQLITIKEGGELYATLFIIRQTHHKSRSLLACCHCPVPCYQKSLLLYLGRRRSRGPIRGEFRRSILAGCPQSVGSSKRRWLGCILRTFHCCLIHSRLEPADQKDQPHKHLRMLIHKRRKKK